MAPRISSCQVYFFSMSSSFKNKMKDVVIKSKKNFKITFVNSNNISNGEITYRDDRRTYIFNYCFNFEKNLFIISGPTSVRDKVTKTFLRFIRNDDNYQLQRIELTKERARDIADDIIQFTDGNIIITPKLFFGTTGYVHTDDTRYEKFEYTLGDNICGMQDHNSFEDFYRNCKTFEFKAIVYTYPGLTNNAEHEAKISVRNPFAFFIYRNLSIIDWYEFVDRIIPHPIDNDDN